MKGAWALGAPTKEQQSPHTSPSVNEGAKLAVKNLIHPALPRALARRAVCATVHALVAFCASQADASRLVVGVVPCLPARAPHLAAGAARRDAMQPFAAQGFRDNHTFSWDSFQSSATLRPHQRRAAVPRDKHLLLRSESRPWPRHLDLALVDIELTDFEPLAACDRG